MTSKPVFVMIFATDCGWCKNFKGKMLVPLKARLSKIDVRVVEITLPSMSSPIPPKYPKDLNRFTKWFPMFPLFTGSSWDAGDKLEGRIFNAIPTNDGSGFRPGHLPMSDEVIAEWISDQLKLAPFINVQKEPNPPQSSSESIPKITYRRRMIT